MRNRKLSLEGKLGAASVAVQAEPKFAAAIQGALLPSIPYAVGIRGCTCE